MSEKKKNILVFVAHSDDEVIGCGGMIAEYSRQGYAVHTIICSFGEQSHPHLKPEVIRKTRVQEAKKADKILGGAGVSFLGLKEGVFLEDIDKEDKRLFNNLLKRFKELKPEKVFTHTASDAHPDHRAVNTITKRLLKKIRFEMYTFQIWSLVNREQGKTPLLYVDISKVFIKKIRALHVFRSQIGLFSHAQINNLHYFGMYIKAFVSGFRLGTRYAESFHHETPHNNR